MMLTRRFAALAAIGLFVAIPRGDIAAQGVTTGAIGGLVTDSTGVPLGQVQIQILHMQTGYSVGGLTRENGRFLISALEAGGPYRVTARRLGLQPQTRDNVFVSLSQTTPVDFRMGQQVARISGVTVVATTSDFSSSRQGVETSISDAQLQRIPTLSRDIVDFVKISPQVVRPPDGSGPSAAGTYNRFNNFTIDGASQNDRFGLGATGGTPGGSTGGRLISMDAVKEMQVLLSPSDVRHGNFSGLLLNAVTKSGTNDFSGGAFFAYRDSKFGANVPVIRNSDLEVAQFGFSLGGPIIKNKLHFFISPEFQQRSQPSTGPFVGQTTNEAGIVAADSVEAVRQALANRFDVGASGRVTNDNPLTNLFGRLDYQFNENHRLVFRQLINSAEVDEFSRNAAQFNTAVGVQSSGFRLSSNSFVRQNKNNSSVLQLYSYFNGGKSNELIVGYNTVKDERIVPVRAPEISIGVVPVGAPAPGTATSASITVGTEQFSPDNLLKQNILEIQNNFTLPWNAHTFTFGARYEHTDIYNNFAQQAFGAYKFASIAALRANNPLNYAFAYSNGGPIAAEFSVGQYSGYMQDAWNVTPKLTMTYGLRVDVPQFLDTPVANDTIAARFQAAGINDVRTDAKPKTQLLWSPRIGINFDPTGDRKNQIRAVVGIFTGPPPLIMIGNAYANTGLGLVRLLCSGTGQVPTFTTDVDQLPRACAGQPTPLAGQAGTAGINITNPNFKYPQNFTGSLGFDRQLPWGTIFTFEGLYRKAINGVLVVDRNIREPLSVGGQAITDRTGRVLYFADTLNAGAGARRVVTTIGRPSVAFSEGVIEVTNQSKDYNWSVSGQLRKRFSGDLDVGGSYTYLVSRDLQSLTSDRAISNWRNGMTPTGLLSDLTLAPSYFDRPHRIVAFGNYTMPWRSWSTNVSLYYEGTSGSVITYIANGDLNGDGFNANDPIYVPTGTSDPNVTFGALSGTTFVPNAAMATDFDNFINENECLADQRGTIMKRNSCRGPWQNRMDFSIRQAFPAVRGQRLSVQLDILNFLNLLNNDWGQLQFPTLSQNFPAQSVLLLRGRSSTNVRTASSQMEFATQVRNNTDETATNAGAFIKRASQESNFYRMLLTVRYSF